MKVIGITGPSGAGKTSALEYLRTKGVRVVYSDKVYHGLLEDCKPMRERIKSRFGTLDRKELGNIVFGDEEALRDLEDITHPYVVDAIRPMLKGEGDVMVEAIALYSSGLADLCDCVICVTAERERLIERITARDGIAREYAEMRLNNGMFGGENAYILENNGDLLSLYARVDAVYAAIRGESTGGNYIKSI